MVAEELYVLPAAICMVAAHVWDAIGRKALAVQELSSPEMVMLLCPRMDYLSRGCRSGGRTRRWAA
jgi:hypothetical protein